jgi:uncharacterized Zn finger protein (UPF0148 family)
MSIDEFEDAASWYAWENSLINCPQCGANRFKIATSKTIICHLCGMEYTLVGLTRSSAEIVKIRDQRLRQAMEFIEEARKANFQEDQQRTIDFIEKARKSLTSAKSRK